MNTRVCRICKLEKPYSEMSKHKQCKDGINTICLLCTRKKAGEWQKNNPERAANNQRNWNKKHPDKRTMMNKRWLNNNKSRVRNTHQAYKIANRARYAAHARKYYWQRPDVFRERSRIWMHEHPEQQRQRNRMRRSRQNNLPDTFTERDWQRALEYFGGRCAVCGRPQGLWHKICRDHWIPITDPRADNPGTVAKNIVPLCHGINGCNNSKKNHDPVKWIRQNFNPRKAKQILDRIEAYFTWVKEHRDSPSQLLADQ